MISASLRPTLFFFFFICSDYLTDVLITKKPIILKSIYFNVLADWKCEGSSPFQVMKLANAAVIQSFVFDLVQSMEILALRLILLLLLHFGLCR